MGSLRYGPPKRARSPFTLGKGIRAGLEGLLGLLRNYDRATTRLIREPDRLVQGLAVCETSRLASQCFRQKEVLSVCGSSLSALSRVAGG